MLLLVFPRFLSLTRLFSQTAIRSKILDVVLLSEVECLRWLISIVTATIIILELTVGIVTRSVDIVLVRATALRFGGEIVSHIASPLHISVPPYRTVAELVERCTVGALISIGLPCHLMRSLTLQCVIVNAILLF